MLDALIAADSHGMTRPELGDDAGIVTTGGTLHLPVRPRSQRARHADGDHIVVTTVLMHGSAA